MADLIALAHDNLLSLAIFKPAAIEGFEVEETAREWDKEQLASLSAKSRQLSLFQTEAELRREFSVVQKLPYKFYYIFRDNQGKRSRLMIEDWEIGSLYWNCLKSAHGKEHEALAQVRKKYLDEFSGKDLYLFLGTIKKVHFWRPPNPFVIIGVFYPAHDPRLPLFT